MNNKFNNLINKFIENSNAKDEQELNEQLQEFIAKYNACELEYEETPLDKAYDLLDKAENAKTKAQALRFAKEAQSVCPTCLDAVLFQADLEDNIFKRDELINNGLKLEEKRLKDEGYFEKESIGSFYGIFETRPYIRGLSCKAYNLACDGKIKQARDICNEILRLNENDNTGSRYLLMAIYAYLEDEDGLLTLYKKYKEEHLEMLFPLFVYYYKQNNVSNACEYLRRIDKSNPNFLKFFKGTMKDDEDIMDGYYSKGAPSEVLMYFNTYTFLIFSVPNIDEFVLENCKKNSGKNPKKSMAKSKSKK